MQNSIEVTFTLVCVCGFWVWCWWWVAFNEMQRVGGKYKVDLPQCRRVNPGADSTIYRCIIALLVVCNNSDLKALRLRKFLILLEKQKKSCYNFRWKNILFVRTKGKKIE